jgi:hypothetical protein
MPPTLAPGPTRERQPRRPAEHGHPGGAIAITAQIACGEVAAARPGTWCMSRGKPWQAPSEPDVACRCPGTGKPMTLADQTRSKR